MTPSSAEFERLVARIEAQLAPCGAVVKSPDHLPDKETGRLREVDASIRVSAGSSELLIVVECRQHGRVQDVTWIEQLISKRASLRADVMVAVSSTGFSEAARAKADANGIRTRRIDDITELEIASWARRVHINASAILLPIYQVRFHFEESAQGAEPSLSAEFTQALESSPLHAPVAYWGAEGKGLNLLQFIASHAEDAVPVDASGPPESTYHLALTFPNRDVYVPTDQGDSTLERLEVTFELKFEPTEATLDRVIRYEGDSGPITDRAEYRLSLRGVEHLILGIGTRQEQEPPTTEPGESSSD